MRRLAVVLVAFVLVGCGTTSQDTNRLPSATLPGLGSSSAVALGDLKGPMVINLWASYCVPCRTEMPHLEEFSKKFGDRVPILGVDYMDNAGPALNFAKSVGATYPMVQDVTPVMRTAALPTTILIDASGKIAYQRPVEVKSEAQLEKLVEQYLGVTP